MPTGKYPHKPQQGFQKNHPNYQTEDGKRRIGIATSKRQKGRKLSEETKKKMSEWGKLHSIRYWLNKKRPNFSEKSRRKMSESGKKRWAKFIKKTPIYHHNKTQEYKEWIKKVFTRDNFTCQKCKIRGVYLEAHHIKSYTHYPKLRFKLNNGITLCKDCHKLTDNYKGKGIKLIYV